jgi:flagellin-like hook-associated protein FlgL
VSALSLLELAQQMLSGTVVAKADAAPAPGTEDPDAIQGKDQRAEGGAPTEEALNEARTEAQAGQQAQGGPEGGAPGEGGALGSDGGEGGEGDAEGGESDEDEGGAPPQVTKAEIMDSIKFLAEFHGLTSDEVTKAFSGLEGYNSGAPVGGGVEILQRIVEGQENQNKILDAIAGFLAELTKKTVSLGTEIGKSLEAAEAAKTTAKAALDNITTAMRSAPAALPKAEAIVAKALGQGGGERTSLTSQDLFKLALEGKMSPTEIASANRSLNYSTPGR